MESQMNIYTNSIAAAEKLLPEAFIGMAVVKENGFTDDQIVAFVPDTKVPSFDILSGPISAKLVVHGQTTALAIAPDSNASIGQIVTSALNAVSNDIMESSSYSPTQKPKK